MCAVYITSPPRTSARDATYDAITVLDRAIAVRPEAKAFTDLGNANFYLRRFDEATSAYEQAVKLGPDDMLLWWNLGDGYYWTPGKRGQSAGAYQRAVSLAESKLKVNPKDAYRLGRPRHLSRDARRKESSVRIAAGGVAADAGRSGYPVQGGADK